MYTGRTNSSSAAPTRTTDTASTVTTSNVATFTVTSVSSSHQDMETSEAFIYSDAMRTAAYILARLTPEEKQNLYSIIDSTTAEEQEYALQQLDNSVDTETQEMQQAVESPCIVGLTDSLNKIRLE